MKNAFLILFFLGLLCFAQSKEIAPVKSRITQIAQTYGFVEGQKYSLQIIAEKYPDLATEAKLAAFSFDSTALGGGFDGVKKEFKATFKDEWPIMKNHIDDNIKKNYSSAGITKDVAKSFLSEVKSRGKGELPQDILATLLSANSRYNKYPELELIEGWKQVFKSKGHSKSKGADFAVSLPASWSKKEGDRPNVIKTYTSNAGHGDVMCMFIVKDLSLTGGYKLTNKEIKELFQPDELKEFAPDGAKVVEAKYIVLDGEHAGFLVSDLIVRRLDFSVKIRQSTFFTYFMGQLISISFMVHSGLDEEVHESLQKQYRPTFMAIANTLVLNKKYKK